MKIKLKIKLLLKSIFNLCIQNKVLKNKILRILGRDYELSPKELAEIKLKADVFNCNSKLKRGNFIVSLTTFPARIHTIKYTLYSIFNQSLLPKKIVLSLNIKEFEGISIEREIIDLEKYGLEILWSNEDIRQYNKIIPTLRQYRDEVIITLDDDIYYPKDLLKGLYEAYEFDNSNIYAQRGRIISLDGQGVSSFSNWALVKKNDYKMQNNPSSRIFLEGVGGVLYPPYSLYSDVDNASLFMNIAPKADDVWLWGMAVLGGRKICIVKNNLMSNGNAMTISPYEQSLWFENLISGNDIQMQNLLVKYPQILQILREEKL